MLATLQEMITKKQQNGKTQNPPKLRTPKVFVGICPMLVHVNVFVLHNKRVSNAIEPKESKYEVEKIIVTFYRGLLVPFFNPQN